MDGDREIWTEREKGWRMTEGYKAKQKESIKEIECKRGRE
jgi:hypothetical protein